MRSASGYKAVWNPRPRDFADQTTPEELASGHRVDAPTVTFVQGTAARPRRRMRVRVPRATPPGIYLILVYDGSEGGAHTTWDYVQVPGAPATTAPTDQAATHPAEPPSRTGALQIALLVLVVLAAVLLTTRIGTRRARRARQAG